MKKNRNKGFSLIEIMVVLCILAVFTAFFVPSFMNLNKASRTKKDITKIESVCTAFKTAMGEPEVQKEANKLADGASLIIVTKIDGNGRIIFGDSILMGDTVDDNIVLKDTKLWANSYQSIEQTYDAESADLINKYIIFYLRPKTTNSTVSCEYMISENKPIPQKCTLKIGVFSNKASADTLVRRLAKDGFSGRVEQDGNSHIVYVGKFRSTQDAQTMRDKLTNSGYAVSLILNN